MLLMSICWISTKRKQTSRDGNDKWLTSSKSIKISVIFKFKNLEDQKRNHNNPFQIFQLSTNVLINMVMVSYCCKTRNFFLTFYVQRKKVAVKATSAASTTVSCIFECALLCRWIKANIFVVKRIFRTSRLTHISFDNFLVNTIFPLFLFHRIVKSLIIS